MSDVDARIRAELETGELTNAQEYAQAAREYADALRAVVDLCEFADETFPHAISAKYLRETIARELGAIT